MGRYVQALAVRRWELSLTDALRSDFYVGPGDFRAVVFLTGNGRKQQVSPLRLRFLAEGQAPVEMTELIGAKTRSYAPIHRRDSSPRFIATLHADDSPHSCRHLAATIRLRGSL